MIPLTAPTPALVALRAQWRSVVGRVGVMSILSAFAITAAITLYMFAFKETSAAVHGGASARLNFLSAAHTLVLTAAYFLPGMLWKGLPPNSRRALHAQPINRQAHELLRVVAGAMLFISFAVIVHLVGAIIEGRFGGGAFASPPVMAWLAALGAPFLLYVFGSIAALVTESATNTLTRVFVYGSFAALAVAMTSGRIRLVATFNEELLKPFLTGTYGLFTALGAGVDGFSGTFELSSAVTLALWMALALAGLWFAAGREARS